MKVERLNGTRGNMAEVGRVGIRLPSSIKQGDVIRVRSLIIHPNELVQRDKQGSIRSQEL